MLTVAVSPGPSQTPLPSPDHPLLLQAKELEATFLSVMLAETGLGSVSDSFGGGVGETQFSSFLRDEQARLIVEKGGIGLAERLFQALSEATP